MAKAIINKHIDSVQDVVLTDLFIKDETNNKGELVICNDPENPTIYIMDTTGNPRKIAGGGGSGSGEAYDDAAIWSAVNKNTEAIEALQNNPGGNIDEIVETLTSDINDVKKTVGELDTTVTSVSEAVETLDATVGTMGETVETLESTVNGVNDSLSAIASTIGEVAEETTVADMISGVQSATETNAQAIEDTKTTISNIEAALTEEIESLKLVDAQNKTDLTTSITAVGTRLNSTIDSIGTVDEGKTVVGMIGEVQSVAEENAKAIADNKVIVDEYTINNNSFTFVNRTD